MYPGALLCVRVLPCKGSSKEGIFHLLALIGNFSRSVRVKGLGFKVQSLEFLGLRLRCVVCKKSWQGSYNSPKHLAPTLFSNTLKKPRKVP